VEESENFVITYSGRSIAKNSIYNILGNIIPLIFALALIPIIIDGLGEEKFGILNLAWVVIGYFSFFDFGIGRTLTKIIAEKIGLKQTEKIPSLFWTSLYLMLGISLLGTLILIFLTPTLVYSFFNISKEIQLEASNTFYVLALSVPLVTTTAGLRGVLEAYQKFGIINVIRVFLGIFTFLVPLVSLIFSKSLFVIVIILISIRFFIWIFYLIQCFKINNNIKKNISFNSVMVKPILTFGGWMTISNIIGPLIIYSDRFLIGSIISATAITYYATPYEVVTKLLLIPSALMGVLFPAFSTTYLNNPEFTKKLLLNGVKYIFILLFPITFVIISFASEGMNLWLGEEFVVKSSMIVQLLAIGVLLNGISYIPFTFLQGIGKPDITAKVHLIEFPIYIVAMWFAIKHFGINGAAMIWLSRIIIDTLVLLLITKKIISFYFRFSINFVYVLLGFTISIVPIYINNTNLKYILVILILLIFSFIAWKYMLKEEEKTFLTSHLKKINF